MKYRIYALYLAAADFLGMNWHVLSTDSNVYIQSNAILPDWKQADAEEDEQLHGRSQLIKSRGC